MNNPIYILSKGILSAATENNTLKFSELPNGQSYYKAIEPDYKAILQPNQIRRSSRIVKLNLAALHFALSTFKPSQFNAIITGTGMGSLEDSERFLTDMIQLEETTLSPTPFIQSTHNTVAGQIALQLQASCYNMTHSQRFLTLDTVLKDAAYILKENEEESFVLACLFDEISPLPFNILKQSGLIQMESNNMYMIGEIASQFVLSNKKNTANSCIYNFSVIKNYNSESLLSFIENSDANLVISGFGNEEKQLSINNYLAENLAKSTSLVHYQSNCGSHFTMNAFGLVLADEILSDKNIPEVFFIKKEEKRTDHILFVYPTYNNNCSVIKIRRC